MLAICLWSQHFLTFEGGGGGGGGGGGVDFELGRDRWVSIGCVSLEICVSRWENVKNEIHIGMTY